MCVFLNLKLVTRKKISVRNNSNNLFGWRMFALIHRLKKVKKGAKSDIKCKMQGGMSQLHTVNSALENFKSEQSPRRFLCCTAAKTHFHQQRATGRNGGIIMGCCWLSKCSRSKAATWLLLGKLLGAINQSTPSQEHRLFYRQKKQVFCFSEK